VWICHGTPTLVILILLLVLLFVYYKFRGTLLRDCFICLTIYVCVGTRNLELEVEPTKNCGRLRLSLSLASICNVKEMDGKLYSCSVIVLVVRLKIGLYKRYLFW